MKAEQITRVKSDCAPAMQAKLAPWMHQLLGERKDLLYTWIEKYGSPIHIVVQSEFHRNVKDLLEPLSSRKVKGGLFFARKANKLECFVEAAGQAGIGVDTASLTELRETLALGIPPEKVILTAIGKSEKLIREAIASGCLLVIENEDELNLLRQIASSHTNPIRIALRFSGFEVNGRAVFSRFGLPVKDSQAIIDRISKEKNLKLVLLHAHLDRYDTEERAMAGRELLRIADYAGRLGIKVSAIDLGGGILMRYIEKEEQWLQFQEELKSAVRGEREHFTYKQDGLGFFKAGQELHGKADFYPVWNPISKERFISAVLDHKHGGSALHEELVARNVELFFEPGRALLDNCGITVANLAYRKRDTLGNLHLGVRMNRMNLRPFRAEFCSDPIFLAKGARERATEGAYLVGCLCSESDTIFRRKLQIENMPEPDDLAVFANSAGYLAHHMEIGTHGDPLPLNLVLDPKSWEIRSAVR